jgi:hypothetical protein
LVLGWVDEEGGEVRGAEVGFLEVGSGVRFGDGFTEFGF